MEVERKCLNCKLPITANFCSNCGQRKKLPRLTFKEIIKDFLSTVFNVDAPFPKTILGLFKQPHALIKGFINGQRKSFYAPIKYMVLCLFLSLLISKLIGFDPIENQKLINGEVSIEDARQRGYEVGNFMAKYLNYFLFIFPFCIALVSKLFFWKHSYNLAERAVFGFYMAGQYVLISVLPTILTLLDPKWMYLINPLGIIYLTIVFYHFFLRKSKIKVFFKSLFAAGISLVLYFGFAYMVAVLLMSRIK